MTRGSNKKPSKIVFGIRGMKKLLYIILFANILAVACKKEEDDPLDIPEGAEPYTEENIQFVPYNATNEKFELMPLLLSSFNIVFKERTRTEAYYAWDQTFFTFSNDPELELELRLRYFQSDVSQKTLAVYLPYRDINDSVQTNLFEIPIEDPDSIEYGFFANLIDFHDTIIINAVEWYDVYEVLPVTSTDAEEDGPGNFEKLFYNKIYGIIELDQKNGDNWILEQ